MKNDSACVDDGNECEKAVLVASVVDLVQKKIVSQITQNYLYGEKAIPNIIPVFSTQNAVGDLFRFSLIPLSPNCMAATYNVIKL